MADDASFAQCFVFIDKRAALCGMTLEAGVVSAEKCDPASVHRLRHVRRVSFYRGPDMWIMAIGTSDFAFEDGMMMRQLELRPDLEVTLKASLWIFVRINDRACAAAGGNVFTTRAVTGFASRVLGVIARRLQSGVRGSAEIAGDIFVAGLARFRPDECCTRNARRCEQGAITFKGGARE
jgi:hypothetical protein